MVERGLPKPETRVRFPSPAPLSIKRTSESAVGLLADLAAGRDCLTDEFAGTPAVQQMAEAVSSKNFRENI